jgi:hypothetical protein
VSLLQLCCSSIAALLQLWCSSVALTPVGAADAAKIAAAAARDDDDDDDERRREPILDSRALIGAVLADIAADEQSLQPLKIAFKRLLQVIHWFTSTQVQILTRFLV